MIVPLVAIVGRNLKKSISIIDFTRLEYLSPKGKAIGKNYFGEEIELDGTSDLKKTYEQI